jgi:Zn-dependent protease
LQFSIAPLTIVRNYLSNLKINLTGENKAEIRELDGLQLIFSLVTHESVQVVLLALGALSNLSLDAENRVAVRQLDGLRILMSLVSSDNSEIQAMAIRTLSWLCYSGNCRFRTFSNCLKTKPIKMKFVI